MLLLATVRLIIILIYFDISNGENECANCSGLVVDTDCGADDAMAISLLLRAESVNQTSKWGKILAFTTVTGNTGAANVTRNVKTLLNLLGRPELPVYRGMEDGISAHIQPTWFYGYDGLGDFLTPSIPGPLLPTDTNTGIYLASVVHQFPGQITILCIGPLTNLAMAVHFNQLFFDEVRHILILGGDYRGAGNIGLGIEANMYSDPDAASYFFNKIPSNASDKVTLLPLETINDLSFPMSFRKDVLGKKNNSVMNFLNKAESPAWSSFGDTWGCYDPTAASTLLDDKLVESKVPAFVVVTNQGPRGAMFASLEAKTNNLNIITKVNKDLLSNILQRYLS